MLRCIVAEKITHRCSEILFAIEANGLGSIPIILTGAEEQRRKYLVKLTKAPNMCTYCVTDRAQGQF